MNLYLLTILLAAFLSCTTAMMTPADYGRTFTGEGTYYGFTTGGNCAMRETLPAIYDDMVPVAINGKQYGNSEICGACVLITDGGAGAGADPIDTSNGPIRAYVHDRCGDCNHGDLDLSKTGDGRWDIEWEFVPCRTSSQLQILFEGSNENYRKMQPRGLSSPPVSFKAEGMVGTMTQDNFFTFQSDAGWPREVNIEIKTVLGQTVTATLKRFKQEGLILASDVNFRDGSNAKPARRTARPRPSKSSAPSKAPLPSSSSSPRPSNSPMPMPSLSPIPRPRMSNSPIPRRSSKPMSRASPKPRPSPSSTPTPMPRSNTSPLIIDGDRSFPMEPMSSTPTAKSTQKPRRKMSRAEKKALRRARRAERRRHKMKPDQQAMQHDHKTLQEQQQKVLEDQRHIVEEQRRKAQRDREATQMNMPRSATMSDKPPSVQTKSQAIADGQRRETDKNTAGKDLVKPPTKGQICVPRWMPCSGRHNHWGTKLCCGERYRCQRVWPRLPMRCVPIVHRPRCVPRGKPCRGRLNRWGTTRCCGNYKCRWVSRLGFRGHRCEPPRQHQ